MFQLAYAGVLTRGEETATNLKDASWLLRADQTSQLVAGAWYIEQRKSCWQAKQTVSSQSHRPLGESIYPLSDLSLGLTSGDGSFPRWHQLFSHTPFPQPTRDTRVGNRDTTKEHLSLCNFVLAASTEAAETSECSSYNHRASALKMNLV